VAGPAVSGEPAGGAAERVPAAVQRVSGAAAQTARRGGRAAGRAQDKQGSAGAHTYIHIHTNCSYSLPLPAQDRLSAAEREAAERDLEARRWKLTAEEAALQVRSTNTRAPEKDSDTLTQSALARELKRAQADLTEAQHDRKALDQELGEEPTLTRPNLV
jgi:hypothetical protein